VPLIFNALINLPTIDQYDLSSIKYFLTGGSAKIPLLAQAIERRAHAPVEVFSPLERIGVDTALVDPAALSTLGPQLAVALGLSMRKDREKRS